MDGDNSTAGMLEMLAAVRKHSPQPCIIAGARGYAYDSDSLVALDAKLKQQARHRSAFFFCALDRLALARIYAALCPCVTTVRAVRRVVRGAAACGTGR